VAENAGGGEKTELPTPRRLEKAREEGQVAFSTEINVAVLLILGLCLLALMAPWFWSAAASCIKHACTDGLRWDGTLDTVVGLVLADAAPLLWWALPFLATMLIAGVALSLLQVGWQPTLKPLMPKPDKLNPITGFGRLFGLRALMRFVFNLLKLSVVIAVAWWAVGNLLPHEIRPVPDVGRRLAQDLWLLFGLAMKLCGVLLLIGFADMLYQRWQHRRDLMMTKQELREEFKQSEGDPLMKGRIRQVQRQIAQRRMMQEVPKADVVITNPTHVAVALKYDRGQMAAPVVVAKGYDAMAQRIKALAREHGVTLVENVTLARALAKEVEIGRPVPVKWYQAVAEVLAMVYKLKQGAA
jgi:flagellar biosynthetic protein FlhB